MDDEYERKAWNAYKSNRTACHLCDDSTGETSYSRDGFSRHLVAKHGHDRKSAFDKEWTISRTELQKCVLIETEALLDELNNQNKVNFADREFMISCENIEMQKSLHAASAELAVKIFAIYLDAAGVLKQVTGDPVVVSCHSEDFQQKFQLWKSVNGSYSTKCCWTKATLTATLSPSVFITEFQRTRDVDPLPIESDIVLATLRRVFGFSDFKPGQRQIIDAILSGRSGLAMMATSAGKTLCFVLPALLSDGVTVAIFPTLSLISDMAERFRDICNLAVVTGETSDNEKDRIFSSLCAPTNQIKLLLTTPESLNDRALQTSLRKVDSLCFVVDEAHCVDRWGKQFRPDYLELKTVFAKYESCQVVALTGTATEKTKTCIISSLGLSDPFIFKLSFNRPNLNFSVLPKGTAAKTMQQIATKLKDSYLDKCCIIYCMTPKECNSISAQFIAEGIPCLTYHGMLEPFEKMTNQTKWQNNEVNVMVATKALGMGIDKPDVRLVVHFTMPGSLDDYYQEAGRAGRDQQPSDCFLFYKLEDRTIHLNHIMKCEDVVQQNHFLEELHAVLMYSNSITCRKAFIMKYYSDFSVDNCKTCDVCLHKNDLPVVDYSTDAQNCVLLLQGLIPVLGKVPFGVFVKVFRGSKEKDIMTKNLNTVPLYGCGKSFSVKDASSFVLFLIFQKVLQENVSSGSRSTFLTPGVNMSSLLQHQLEIKTSLNKFL